MRDKNGMSRIGYLDIDPNNPLEVIALSDKPCLDLGNVGYFDEHGVVPCAITKINDKFAMYYAGYQQGKSVRFFAYSGLALSDDGITFNRHQNVPILERSNDEILFRVIHSILPDKNGWRVWYGAGNHFGDGLKKTLPTYNIYTMHSEDAIHYPRKGELALEAKGEEYRVGRPYVFKHKNGYLMFYGYGSEQKPYKIGLASSVDGKKWDRIDDSVIFKKGFDDSDNEMQAYPSLVEVNGNFLFFYNGNNYGFDGMCCASLSLEESES